MINLLDFPLDLLFLLFAELLLLLMEVDLSLFLESFHQFVHVLNVGYFLVPELIVVFELGV